MDPHVTRESVKNLRSKEDSSTYFTKDIHFLNFRQMQPSFTVGFMFQTLEEFINFKHFCEEHSKLKFPCFGFMLNEEKKKLDEDAVEKMADIMNDQDDF